MKAEYVDCEMNLEVERGGDIRIAGNYKSTPRIPRSGLLFCFRLPDSEIVPRYANADVARRTGDRYTDCSLGTATDTQTVALALPPP